MTKWSFLCEIDIDWSMQPVNKLAIHLFNNYVMNTFLAKEPHYIGSQVTIHEHENEATKSGRDLHNS